MVPALAQVAAWARSQHYSALAINMFMQVANHYLVAQALAGSHAIVAHEVPSASTRRVKIPDTCIRLGIKCLTRFEMLRNERARFVLGRSP